MAVATDGAPLQRLCLAQYRSSMTASDPRRRGRNEDSPETALSRARWNTFIILILRRASDGLDAPGASAARQGWQALC